MLQCSLIECNKPFLENTSDSASVQTLNSESYQEFIKRNHGQYIVLFDFKAVQEDDIAVRQGDRVTVLNKDDVDWYWVKTQDGEEGFAPREYLRHISPSSKSGRFLSLYHSGVWMEMGIGEVCLTQICMVM